MLHCREGLPLEVHIKHASRTVHVKTGKSLMRASDHPPARHFNLHLYTFSLIDRAASEDPATSCPVVTTEPHDGKLAETISHAMQNVRIGAMVTDDLERTRDDYVPRVLSRLSITIAPMHSA